MLRKKALILSALLLTSLSLIAGVVVLTIQAANDETKADTTYTVSFDTVGGTPIESIEVKEGDKISKPNDPIKNGCHIKNWTLKGEPWIFDSYIVSSNITLTANWDYDQFTINYDFNGGTATEQYNTSYNVDSDFDLATATKKGAIFGGWFDKENHRIDKIVKGMTGNLFLKANWIEEFIIKNLDESRGTISVRTEDSGEITVESTPINNKHHVFIGWFDENDNLLSDKNIYTFALDSQKTVFVNAKYMTDAEENDWNMSHGVTPILDELNNTIEFGMYPQSNVDDPALIGELENSIQTEYNGYFYYNHEYYLKKKASLYTSEDEHEYLSIHNFDNGTEIVDGSSYWFKVEPIEWKILEKNGSAYSIATQKLLDRVRYYESADIREIDETSIYPNNYKFSTIRNWMNETFFVNAFNFNKQPLSKVVVDNSSSTTAVENNKYICDNTKDYVFALSYKEYLKTEYGFTDNINSTPTRSFKTTDLARASGALYSTEVDNTYCGYTWTRSPYSGGKTGPGLGVSRISKDGTINYCWDGADYSCAQPCINITL